MLNKKTEFNYIKAPAHPMVLEGFPWYEKDRVFCRLPQHGLPLLNDELRKLAWNTAGGTLRFSTDSTCIAIRYLLNHWHGYTPKMPATGHSGLDIYAGSGENYTYIGNMLPVENQLEQEIVVRNETGSRDITVYFPPYTAVDKLFVGIGESAVIAPPTPRKNEGKIVIYGPSIAQGACVSRPACAYPHILSRWLDMEIINLGFSGVCKGEPEMAQLINEIPMRLFIMDYDHNAPDPHHLWLTHEPFYKIIREKNLKIPIVFVTKPNTSPGDPEEIERRKIIKTTYDNAKERNENVFYINGLSLFGDKDRDLCTTDGGHPNDLGFYRMAEAIFPTVRDALAKV
jgi:hypothetical protein